MPNYDMPIPLDQNTMQPMDGGVSQQPNFRWQAKAGNQARGFLGNQDLALALLANSGYSHQKRSFGEIVGSSMLQANQMKQGREDDAFKRQYMQAQMQAMQGKQQGPNSVQEYEYAKKNGYTGSFQDWTTISGQTSRPSSVQEWEFYNKLPQDQKQLYLEMKRNPNWKVTDINQVPTVVQGGPGGAVSSTQLSTLPQVAASAETVRQAEQRGGAIGSAQGGISGGIQTKGADAQQMMGAIQMADGLLDKSTGSWVGSVIDKGAAAFGKSTEGAQAGASLKVLQASLLSFVPKMSGPQSDADREVYIQAVGQIGDTATPIATRKAALQTVTRIQQQYMQNAGGSQSFSIVGKPPETARPRKRYNPATGKIEDAGS